jgi:hypothetical protein
MNHPLSEYPTAELIHLGRLLSAQITAAKAELEAVEEILRTRALAMPHEPLADGNREGRRAMLRDGGEQVSVLFESDILKASFASDSPVAKAVLPLLDAAQISQLFRLKTTYERAVKDGHKFRLQCADLLPAELSAQIIGLLKDRDRNGIVKSKSVIEWKAA